MKKFIAIVAGVVVAGIAVILYIASTKPDAFHVERSLTMKASPAEIASRINNFHNWGWSPWENIDPNMKRTYSGPESGVGAKYAWVGNGDVGEGDMEILSAEPTKTEIKLHFIKPFEGNSKAIFTMVPEGNETKVTWAMDGESAFISKIMQVAVSMDDCCGKEFAKGLASLKSAAEKTQTAEKEHGDNG